MDHLPDGVTSVEWYQRGPGVLLGEDPEYLVSERLADRRDALEIENDLAETVETGK